MNKLFSTLIITLLLAFNLGAFALPSPATSSSGSVEPINRIVAVVNQEIVTQSDVDNAVDAAKQQFRQRGIPIPSDKKLKDKIIQGLIYQKLQLQIASQNKIKATQAQVDAAIGHIAKQNNMTLDQLKQKLKDQNIDFSAFQKQIRDQLIVSNLQQQAISGSLNITKAQIQAFKLKLQKQNETNDYYIVDYLVPLQAHPTSTQKYSALKNAQHLIQQLKNGKHISKSDPLIKTNDMGWQPLSDLPDLFSVPVAKMKKGGVSQPILAGNGYHVLKLVNIKKDLGTVSDQQAQKMLFQQKFRKALEKWLKQLRKNAYIKIYPSS